MATSFTLNCPECEKPVKASDTLVGKKIRCKGCEHVFVVEAPEEKPAKSKAGTGKPPAKAVTTKPGAPAKGVTTKPGAPDKKGPAKPADDDDGDGKPYGMTFEKLGARCPECANEMESEEAIICLHCGYNTHTRSRASTKKTYDVTGQDVFMHLLPGILNVVGIIVLLVFDIVYTVNIATWSHDQWYEFMSSGAIVLWVWIISCFAFFAMGRSAFIRLLLDNEPPEVEKKK
jgi:DNA-directed RNA polymerase subunit RPC12/RpoP